MSYLGNSICPDDFYPFGAFCYRFITDQMEWRQARDKCSSYNAYLAEPYTATQNNYLKALGGLFGGGKRFWLGATDSKTTNVFIWSHSGQAVDRLGFSDWYRGEPSDSYGGTEDCLEIWDAGNGNYQWNDAPCDATQAFVCQCERLRKD